MKILVVDYDLFAAVGGGQTFYRGLIEKHPNHTFYYFQEVEATTAKRPKNAKPVPKRNRYSTRFFRGATAAGQGGLDDHGFIDAQRLQGWFVEANNLAHSVAGQHFDVVDVPDYRAHCFLLPAALARHGVSFDRLALSLHGRCSVSMRLDWFAASTEVKAPELERAERLQFRTAALRYGLSPSYLETLAADEGASCHLFYLLEYFDLPVPSRPPPANGPPDIQFIGRPEKRKGPELFVDLAWSLPRASYGTARLIGGPVYGPRGESSDSFLGPYIKRRLPDLVRLPERPYRALQGLFARRTLTILPSRYDTLNLVALESLLAGCPTAIGTGAGAGEFLRRFYPKVPFVSIDPANAHSAVAAIEQLLGNYDHERSVLIQALEETPPPSIGRRLEAIYAAPATPDVSARKEASQLYDALLEAYKRGQREHRLTASLVSIGDQAQPLVAMATRPLRQLRRELRPRARLRAMQTDFIHHLKTRWRPTALLGYQALRAGQLARRCTAAFALPESSDTDLCDKIRTLQKLAPRVQIGRVHLWRELARLEHLRGNDLIACCYRLRVLRWLGTDTFSDLPAIVRTLEHQGYTKEARTAHAMFADDGAARERCAKLLAEAWQDHLCRPTYGPFEFVEDRRPPRPVRVSIIVSLYNAGSQLARFLSAIEQQTLVRSGAAEIILLDSGSPTNEYEIFRTHFPDLPVVYARTARRETIQKAWNRAIGLARAPYLTFLGVDEGITTDALEVLAAELDRDPKLDWVQGSAVVTNVDSSGQWVEDIMCYDRSPCPSTLVYLETCHLSWVGALYRKSIHDRYGYYDPSFGAAGDTEFKNRILPHIQLKSLPRTLGVFWNYPTGQTTAHPRAEIEDLRAYYLHRTVAGIAYGFDRHEPAHALQALSAALRYRKSYLARTSTDLDYADSVASYLHSKEALGRRPRQAIADLLRAYRRLDWASNRSVARQRVTLLGALKQAGKTRWDTTRLGAGPGTSLFSDNRYEQHVNVWNGRR